MDNKGNKIGLSLSGGGYRAAAYHIGTLRALHKMGILDKVDVISSVSGGSIAAAYYLLHKDNFENYDSSFSRKLGRGVMHLAFINVFTLVIVFIAIGILFRGLGALLILVIFWFFCYKVLPLSFFVRLQYIIQFFGKKTLSDLPDSPSLVINTTDVAQACLFKFSKNRAWGYNYHDRNTHQDFITGVGFPLSTAVMASSCVPFAFTPIRIKDKYCKQKAAKMPLLIDGGLYDNQGVHELGEDGDYFAKYIIVSNAGNTDLSDKHIWNVILMLVKTSNILMKRIEKLQSRSNMFLTDNSNQRYAYVNLNYDATDRLVRSFVINIACGLVPREVYTAHGITEEEVFPIIELFKKSHFIDSNIQTDFEERVKASIGWSSLEKQCPTLEETVIAKGVSTNLIGLGKKKRDALAKFAEWMTYVQVRMYLPNLV